MGATVSVEHRLAPTQVYISPYYVSFIINSIEAVRAIYIYMCVCVAVLLFISAAPIVQFFVKKKENRIN